MWGGFGHMRAIIISRELESRITHMRSENVYGDSYMTLFAYTHLFMLVSHVKVLHFKEEFTWIILMLQLSLKQNEKSGGFIKLLDLDPLYLFANMNINILQGPFINIILCKATISSLLEWNGDKELQLHMILNNNHSISTHY